MISRMEEKAMRRYVYVSVYNDVRKRGVWYSDKGE